MTNAPTIFTSSTITEIPADLEPPQICIDYIISLAVVSSLFITSELLPFLKSQKGNGLVDLLICCLQGSDCCLSKLIDCLKGEKDDENSVSQEQQQSLNNENQTSQNVNININTERNDNNK